MSDAVDCLPAAVGLGNGRCAQVVGALWVAGTEAEQGEVEIGGNLRVVDQPIIRECGVWAAGVYAG